MDAKAAPTTPRTSPTDRDGRSVAGFALFELVLALAILGLVVAVVFPRVARAPGPAELRNKAQAVAALLRTDRNAALRSGQDVVSKIDVDRGIITSGSAGTRIGLARGVKATFVQSSRELRDDGGGIRFRPDGRSSGGVLYLSRKGASYEISVNWLTSSVLVAAAAQPAGG